MKRKTGLIALAAALVLSGCSSVWVDERNESIIQPTIEYSYLPRTG